MTGALETQLREYERIARDANYTRLLFGLEETTFSHEDCQLLLRVERRRRMAGEIVTMALDIKRDLEEQFELTAPEPEPNDAEARETLKTIVYGIDPT